MKRAIGMLVLAGTFFVASVVGAQAPSAATLFRRGMAAFGAERYAEAASLFESAHALSGDAHMLYNLALARDRAGDTTGALASYRDFVSAWPDAPNRAEVEARIAELAPPEPEPAPTPLVEPVPIEPQPVTDPTIATAPLEVPPPSEQGLSAGGPVLLGLGVAGMVTALVVGVVASDTHGRAEAEPVQLTAIALGREAETLALAANVTWALAGALTIGGGIWTIVELTSSPATRTTTRLRLGPTSATFSAWF